MPLKALHPLLEDGCIEDEKPTADKKCAFIGISNWVSLISYNKRKIFQNIFGRPWTRPR